MYNRFLNRLLTVVLMLASECAFVWAQDAKPAPAMPVTPMDRVYMPAHVNPGLAVDLDNPASYLYPEWSNAYVHKLRMWSFRIRSSSR